MFLLDHDRNAPDWINWDIWIKQNPGSALSAPPRQRCETYSHSIGRAISGEGIALASCALLCEELNTGALIARDEERYQTGKSYFLAHRAGVSLHDGVAGFAHFLQAFGTSL
ncbi:hypothetical protein K3X13_13405 [Aliiroseovarius crassostreae]|uniref:hypothetical protein n=1 Tax=Aliiroseovarius crassostreae TaxID=154981 RepID=UPI002200F3D6|nr:hypothetical protein [Aliiroseovarius crassostreae]UWP92005.1 hypothetical protein K3X13_13405 [Aliiroseovarius crassostreae]